jgi:hypothetical protein
MRTGRTRPLDGRLCEVSSGARSPAPRARRSDQLLIGNCFLPTDRKLLFTGPEGLGFGGGDFKRFLSYTFLKTKDAPLDFEFIKKLSNSSIANGLTQTK